MWGDGWLPVKIVNPTSAFLCKVTAAKIADVYLCVTLEDFDYDFVSS